MNWFHNKKYHLALFLIFLAFWVLTAIHPKYPKEFILEHSLTVIFALLLIFTYKKFLLSNVSYTLIFIFMILHTIGAHYTYAEVPYNDWSESLLGFRINDLFGFSRNHYDRFVHFSFGLLMAYPLREIFIRIVNVRGFWGYYLPFDVMAAFSVVYELIEWAVALIFGGELGMAYLGTQGDIWDAHKDMALAISGAAVNMLVVAFINIHYKRNFGRDMHESFAVKRKTPLGEVELEKMRNNKKAKK